MLVVSGTMNINDSPSILKDISVRKVLNFTKNVLYQITQMYLFVNLRGK
jgi:hypothetical protein